MSFKRIAAFIFACGLIAGAWGAPVQAHPADEAAVFHYLWLQPRKGEVSLQHGTIVGGLLTQAVWPTIDANGDNELSVEEQEAHARSIVAGLSVRIDGKPVKWKLELYEYPSHTEFFGTSFAAIKLLLTVPIDKVTAKGRSIEIRDESFPHFKGVFPQPVIRPDGLAAKPLVVSEDGRVTRLRLLPEGTPVAAAPPTPDPAPAAENGKPRLEGLALTPSSAPNGPATTDIPSLDASKIFPKPEAFAVSTEGGHGGETAKLKGFLNRPLTPGLLAVALLAALLAGMAHAFSPGHGKSMVAAYLVGSEGRVRDAVALGVVVTITHTLGVYLLGFLTLWLTTSFQVAQVGLWLEVVSGALVLGMGFWLFQRGLLAYHGVKPLPGNAHGLGGHSHGHAHDYGHTHAHDGPAASRASAEAVRRPPSDSPLDDPAAPGTTVSSSKHDRWGLIGLGVAGGMVPCFDALAILIAAVNLASGRPPQEKAQYIGAGLGLIGAFSVGMALVLVAIGILMVKAKDLMARFTGESRLMRGLPAASGAVLFFLGAWLTLQGLVHAGALKVG